MRISCKTCRYDKDCFQYQRNRKAECIDREYILYDPIKYTFTIADESKTSCNTCIYNARLKLNGYAFRNTVTCGKGCYKKCKDGNYKYWDSGEEFLTEDEMEL
jgi:hypothetical protein